MRAGAGAMGEADQVWGLGVAVLGLVKRLPALKAEGIDVARAARRLKPFITSLAPGRKSKALRSCRRERKNHLDQRQGPSRVFEYPRGAYIWL